MIDGNVKRFIIAGNDHYRFQNNRTCSHRRRDRFPSFSVRNPLASRCSESFITDFVSIQYSPFLSCRNSRTFLFCDDTAADISEYQKHLVSDTGSRGFQYIEFYISSGRQKLKK